MKFIKFSPSEAVLQAANYRLQKFTLLGIILNITINDNDNNMCFYLLLVFITQSVEVA